MTPGSSEARSKGCTCPIIDNHYGAGQDRGGKLPVFVINLSCPLHKDGADQPILFEDEDDSAYAPLASFVDAQREWSLRTFGPDPRTASLLAHIRKELVEIEAQPMDLEEWIDVMILAMDGAWRTGASSEEISEALARKQAKNRARAWPDWRTLPDGVPSEHIREPEERA